MQREGITHLTGALYHPATNGAAERLVETFKQALTKSSLPPRAAALEFLMQYRRTPLVSGYSPSEILNGRQIRCKIDVLFFLLLTLPKQNRQQQLLSLHPLLLPAKWPEWLTLSKLATLVMPLTADLSETRIHVGYMQC